MPGAHQSCDDIQVQLAAVEHSVNGLVAALVTVSVSAACSGGGGAATADFGPDRQMGTVPATRRKGGVESAMVTRASVLTCPACGVSSPEEMPEDRCVVRYVCAACGEELRPDPGDCCVFCTYGSRPCPPEQAGGSYAPDGTAARP